MTSVSSWEREKQVEVVKHLILIRLILRFLLIKRFLNKNKKKRSSGRFSADAKKKTSLEQKNKNKKRKQNTKKVVRDDGLRGYYTQADSPWSVIEADVADMSYVQNTTFLEDFRDGRDLKYNEEIVKDHQYRYLLVVVDVYSSYVFVEPLINKDADSMVNAMKRILSKQNYFKPSGYTRLFSSDRGGEFLNKKLRSLMDKKSYLMKQRENHA